MEGLASSLPDAESMTDIFLAVADRKEAMADDVEGKAGRENRSRRARLR